MMARGAAVIGSRTVLLRTALIWTLLELLAATQVYTAAGIPVVWVWLHDAAEPAVWTARQLAELATTATTAMRQTGRLVAENRRLRLALESARARIVLLEEDRTALDQAARLLDAAAVFEPSAVAGRCVYRNLQQGSMEVWVEPRSLIPRDTPVVGAGGLVGRVVHVAGRSCWVELLTHPAAAVAVQTVDGTVQGLAAGSGRAELSVEYVPRSAALLRGEPLVTSGADGVYPPGIPVAEVTRIRESDASFLEVTAALGSDLATLRVVLLLPQWTPARAHAEGR
jgi:rod shape-determining protein MreC